MRIVIQSRFRTCAESHRGGPGAHQPGQSEGGSRLTARMSALAIAGMPITVGDPGIRAFHDPPMGKKGEPDPAQLVHGRAHPSVVEVVKALPGTSVKRQRLFWHQACTCCHSATGAGGPNSTNANGRKKTKRLNGFRLCSGCQPCFKADRIRFTARSGMR